jgi:hypothetical protein
LVLWWEEGIVLCRERKERIEGGVGAEERGDRGRRRRR